MRLVSFIVIATIAATATVTSSKSVPVVQHRQLRSTSLVGTVESVQEQQQQINQEVQQNEDIDSNTNRKLNIVDGLGGIINDIIGNDKNDTDTDTDTDSSSNNKNNTLTDKVTNVANEALFNLTGYNSSVVTQLINIFNGNETSKLVPDGTIDDIIINILQNATLVDEILQSNGNIDSELISTIIENYFGLNYIGMQLNLTSILGNDTLFNTSSIFNTIVNETNTSTIFDTIQEYLQENNTAATIVPSAYFQNIISDTFFNRTNNDNNMNDDNDNNDKDKNFTLSDILNFNWNSTGIVMDLLSINNVTDLWNELRDSDNNNSSTTLKNESAAILQQVPTSAPLSSISSIVPVPTTTSNTNSTKTNTTKTNTTGSSSTTTTSNANMEPTLIKTSSFLLGTLLIVATIL